MIKADLGTPKNRTTYFWTFLSYGNGLISTLRITSGILKRQRPPLSAVVSVTGNGQKCAECSLVGQITLCCYSEDLCVSASRKICQAAFS